MKIDRYLELCKIIEAEEKRVEEGKRESYTVGDENVLANFMRDAATAGIDPLQNWLTHFLKQVAAVVSYIRNPDVEPSEPLISRVVDLRVYSKLLLALAEDEGRVTGVEGGKTADETLAKLRAFPEKSDKRNWNKCPDCYESVPDGPYVEPYVIPLTVSVQAVPGSHMKSEEKCVDNLRHVLSTGMHDYTFGKDW